MIKRIVHRLIYINFSGVMISSVFQIQQQYVYSSAAHFLPYPYQTNEWYFSAFLYLYQTHSFFQEHAHSVRHHSTAVLTQPFIAHISKHFQTTSKSRFHFQHVKWTPKPAGLIYKPVSTFSKLPHPPALSIVSLTVEI